MTVAKFCPGSQELQSIALLNQHDVLVRPREDKLS